MQVIQCDNYVILELERSSKLDTLVDYLSRNESSYPHIIIDIINFNSDGHEIVSKLFPFHLNWEKRNKSFILVSLIARDLLKNLVSLNSREEAVDFFHMEELTRTIK